MKYLLILFLLSCFQGYSQSKNQSHSIDSCSKCKCKKFHRTIEKDSLTQEKIIILFKNKGRHCQCNNVDSYCKYKSIQTQYYRNGKTHIKTTVSGWASGWGGKSRTIQVFYDNTGKQISKTIKREDD